jgi:prepilin-type processing-associated H-X9-DG protein
MSDATPAPRTSILAVVSLLLGLLSVAPLFLLCGIPPLLIVAGLPALVLGVVAVRRINRSDGRLRGRIAAVAAMILGGLGTVVEFAGFGAGVVLNLQESAHQVECQDNLREIGQAVALYHDEHQHFPPGTIPNPDLPPEKRLSWLAAILPHLHLDQERRLAKRGVTAPVRGGKARAAWQALDRARAWDAEENRPAVATSLPEYLCPSNPERAAPGEPALTHYVGLSGLAADAARLPADDPRAGFFGYDRVLTRKQLQDARGESRTVMAAETALDNGPWAAGGGPTVRGLDPAQRPYLGRGRPPGGIHATGLNVLYADGAVGFFLDTMEPETFEALVPISAPP